MPAGLTVNDSMFSVREEPGYGLGVVLEQPPVTIAEAIELSGLGWPVEREPIAVDRGDAATADDWLSGRAITRAAPTRRRSMSWRISASTRGRQRPDLDGARS